MELVRVRNLCGTFCFSMQFVVLTDLIGTVVLPAAISLTVVLIVKAIMNPPKERPTGRKVAARELLFEVVQFNSAQKL